MNLCVLDLGIRVVPSETRSLSRRNPAVLKANTDVPAGCESRMEKKCLADFDNAGRSGLRAPDGLTASAARGD